MVTSGPPTAQRELPLTPDEREALYSLIISLRQRYGDDLQRVVLFGSKARGDSDPESDLDVLVVLKGNADWGRRCEITDLTTHLLLKTGINISALVRDQATYQWWTAHHAPIYNSIQRDGVDLWTKRSEPSSRSA